MGDDEAANCGGGLFIGDNDFVLVSARGLVRVNDACNAWIDRYQLHLLTAAASYREGLRSLKKSNSEVGMARSLEL
jgi:hypothetical protein